jgi:hypothetical protein
VVESTQAQETGQVEVKNSKKQKKNKQRRKKKKKSNNIENAQVTNDTAENEKDKVIIEKFFQPDFFFFSFLLGFPNSSFYSFIL